MRIHLIHPPSNFLAQGYGVKQKVRFGFMPPLGIGYIAAYLERDGHEVAILDATAEELSIDETVDRIEAYGARLVGLSTLTNYADHAKILAAAIKQRCPDMTVLLGGAHTVAFYNEILDDMPGVDHVLRGEVDLVINDYVRLLDEPEQLHRLNGLVYRDADGAVVVNPPAAVVEDMDQLPIPAYHLYDMKLYRPLPFQFRQSPVFTMITSRGCAWAKCTFCFQGGKTGPKFRRHSVGRVLDEMEYLKTKFGIREIHFWDDIFVLNKHWLEEFAEGVKARRLDDVSWVGSVQANVAKPGMIRLAREAGCWSLFVGVESGVQTLLDDMKKGTTLEQVRTVMKECREFGVETRAAFMLGLPNETPELGKQTIDFAIEIDPSYAIFYAAHPRRGTAMYDTAQAYGNFIDKEYRGMSRVTYVPEGYDSPEQLAEMVQSAYRRFYMRPRIFLRTLQRVGSWGDLKELALAFFLYVGLSDFFAPGRRVIERVTDSMRGRKVSPSN